MKNKRPTEADLKSMGLVWDESQQMYVKRHVSIASPSAIQKIEYTKLQSSEVNNKELIAFALPKGRPNLEKEQLKLHEHSKQTITVRVKPISVNTVWQGRRFKTPSYKKYEEKIIALLPDINIPKAPYKIYFKFGFSSKASDWDNPIKPTQDILSKRYGFNDKLIRRAIIETEIVPKGREYFVFRIESL